MIATDNDREGENIGFEVIEECLKSNRRLIVKRMLFTAVTNHEVHRALENLSEPVIHFNTPFVTYSQPTPSLSLLVSRLYLLLFLSLARALLHLFMLLDGDLVCYPYVCS